MERVLTYTLREEDMTATAGGLVNLVLKNCVKVTGHEISAAKFTPDGITCDGALIHVSERMSPGQTLRVVLPEERDETKLIAAEGPVRVLYEDEDLIAVDKLPGEVVHPGPGHYTDTIANRITWYLQKQAAAGDAAKGPEGTAEQQERTVFPRADANEESAAAHISVSADQEIASGEHEAGTAAASGLRVIGRLDKETSGVLIYAKNRAAAARLQRQRRDGTFVRTYLAVCEGIFPAGQRIGTIDLPIEKEPGVLMRMRAAEDGGLRAVTHYEVLKEFHAGQERKHPAGFPESRPGGNTQEASPANCNRLTEERKDVTEEQAADPSAACSLLRVTIETGRTHQIRVHMAAIGHPLVGDTLYGSGAAQTEGHVKSMPDVGAAQAAEEFSAHTDFKAAYPLTGPQHALLHAAEVRLLQPFTGEPLHISSRLTGEFIHRAEIRTPMISGRCPHAAGRKRTHAGSL